MKISKVRSTATPATKKSGKQLPAGGLSFADHLDKPDNVMSAVDAVAGNAAISPVNSVLAVQEAAPDGEQRARGQLSRRGEDILDRLDEIRHDILIGAIPKDRLANLARLLRAKRQTVSDPKLIEIIDAIELRAEVEIAKLTRRI